jgi:hypothetical protein
VILHDCANFDYVYGGNLLVVADTSFGKTADGGE